MFYNEYMNLRGLILLFMMTILLTGCKYPASTREQSTPSPSPTHIEPTFTPFITATASTIPSTSTPGLPLDLKKGPYLIFTGTPDGMAVIWQGESNESYLFEWGLDNSFSLGSSTPGADPATSLFQVRLSGLIPATRYLYRISTLTAEVHGSFVMPPANSDSLIFFAFGDTRSGPETMNEITASIMQSIAANPSAQTFVIDTGDLMNIATEESLQENFFAHDQYDIRALLAVMPVVNVMGNHDGTALFKQYFPYPYTRTYDWSFDYGPAHFVIIDQYIDLVQGSERWFWLKNDLSTSQKPWKFILLHEPGWSAGPHENNETVQTVIQPMAVAYGVQMIIAGHNHYYARAEVEGVTHVTTGGGGAPLYDPENGWPFIKARIKAFHYIKFIIEKEVLTAQVLSPQGDLLDEFTMSLQEIP